MKFLLSVALAIAIVSFAATFAESQSPLENWLIPPTATITRDQQAVATLRMALTGMKPKADLSLLDISVLYRVSKWSGADASGLCTESSINLFAYSRSIKIDGAVVHHTILRNGTRTSEAAGGVSHAVSDRRTLESLPYQPVLLIQEVLLNARDEVRSIPELYDSSNADGVRVVIRGPDWAPEQRDLTSASFDLYFSKDTHLLSRITGVQHIDGHPMNFVPYSIFYSDYQQFQTLLLPRSIDERIAGRSTNVMSVAGVAINQGITVQSLQ